MAICYYCFLLAANFSKICFCFSISPARSPIFKAMFSTQMTESIQNVVEIEDFNEETVREMLEFVYTGETNSLTENSMKMNAHYQVVQVKF